MSRINIHVPICLTWVDMVCTRKSNKRSNSKVDFMYMLSPTITLESEFPVQVKTKMLVLLQPSSKNRKQRLLLCSISFISPGAIFNLSTCSRSTLVHFCNDSMMVQGRDMSTTSTARLSFSDSAVTANFSKPLWYRSPSRIQMLQRVKSGRFVNKKN